MTECTDRLLNCRSTTILLSPLSNLRDSAQNWAARPIRTRTRLHLPRGTTSIRRRACSSFHPLLLLVRIRLMVGLTTLDATLFRSSGIVSPDWSQGFSSRFHRLSGQTFAPYNRRPPFCRLGVSLIKSPASKAPTGMVAARVIPTGLKTSTSTLRNYTETTATIKCADVVKVWMRAHF